MNKGLTHIYTGEGKGKTTCAMGMALRAAGNGLTVCIFQFCKTGPTGEMRPLEALDNVRFVRAEACTNKFVWDLTPEEKVIWCEAQQALFDDACDACCDKSTDLVILDEVLVAMNGGAVDASQISYLIDHKYKGTELVLTGRGAPQALIDKADYVTEMRMIKHPYSEGVHARKGIEY